MWQPIDFTLVVKLDAITLGADVVRETEGHIDAHVNAVGIGPCAVRDPQHASTYIARDLDDLRRIVQTLSGKGVRIEFVKEHLTFTGEDSPMANLMLSVMGAFAEFERALLRERQREGIALAKQRGAYRGRKRALSQTAVAKLRGRVAAGISKAQ